MSKIMAYKFYVKKDGKTFGPYSATVVRDLRLKDDILVRKESEDEWLPAARFDFEDMAQKELRGTGAPFGFTGCGAFSMAYIGLQY